MEVKKGEFIAIMGPSGCGKSTLLHILGLLDNPDEGSYLLEGEEVGHLKEKGRTRYRWDALVSSSKASISLTSLQSRKT